MPHVWENNAVKLHGSDVPHHPYQPDIYATCWVDSVTRAGSTITATVGASFNALGGSSYYGYDISIGVSIDTGAVVSLVTKPASASQWSSDVYKTASDVSVSSTNTGDTSTIHFWVLAPDCPECSSHYPETASWCEVASYADYAPIPPMTYTVTVDPNGGYAVISGVHHTEPQTLTKTYDQTLTINYDMQRSGYRCLGLSTNQSATTASYQMPYSYTTNAPATLYAVWKKLSPFYRRTSNGWVNTDPIIWQMYNGSWRKVEPYYVCRTIGGKKGWCRSDDLTKLVYDENGDLIT